MESEKKEIWNLFSISFLNKAEIVFAVLLFAIGLGCDSDDDNRTVEPEPEMVLDLVEIAGGFVSPVGVVAAPGENENLYVIDQVGMVWLIDNSSTVQEEPFLDVSDKIVDLESDYDERGLLGLAFHPDFQNNGRVFVYYTAPPNPGGPEEGESWNNISRISEFTVQNGDPQMVDPGSEKIVLEIDQPQGNHEGGTIAFGPDGYLYISIGDGGNANDVAPGHVEDWYDTNSGGNGQDIESNLLGNILRIDVDGMQPYSIPADNPFVDSPGLSEIYAYGFRNPFRFSFDMGGTNQLIVGDAGQGLYEEIDVVESGQNYGWNVKEGTICFDASDNTNILETCPDTDVYGRTLQDPVIEIANAANPSGGITVTVIGGNVYRGNTIPELAGKYIFGSFSSNFEPNGEVFVATPSGNSNWSFESLDFYSYSNGLGYFVKGFGQDMEGEIYVTTSSNLGPAGTTGKVLKISLVEKVGMN